MSAIDSMSSPVFRAKSARLSSVSSENSLRVGSSSRLLSPKNSRKNGVVP